jgi:hypothetical protein
MLIKKINAFGTMMKIVSIGLHLYVKTIIAVGETQLKPS